MSRKEKSKETEIRILLSTIYLCNITDEDSLKLNLILYDRNGHFTFIKLFLIILLETLITSHC